MFKNDRYNKILEILEQKKVVSPAYLQRRVFASDSTLRRDLIALEKMGRISRHFGEVKLIKPNNVELSYMFRQQEHEQEKKAIARVASTFMGDNQALFIDSSSTASFLAPFLSALRNTIVVTNGLRLAVALDGLPQVKTFLAGGRLRAGSGSMLGDDALEFISNFRADVAFMSCSGITADGVFMASQEQSTIKRKMMTLSDQVVLLCDHSKFNTKDYFRLSDPTGITALVTDDQADPALRVSWEQRGVEVLS